jgi:hypothetical protein
VEEGLGRAEEHARPVIRPKPESPTDIRPRGWWQVLAPEPSSGWG